jgi:PAS domain S-box-containing protein
MILLSSVRDPTPVRWSVRSPGGNGLFEARATAGDVEADASLKAILDCVALPVWVVDHEGLVVLANPAALTTLGFDELSELRGRHGHDTVHYKHPDGSPYPVEDCPVLEPSRTGRPVHRDEDWFIRRDGTMIPVSFTAVPIDLPTGRGVVMTFIDTSPQRQAEQSLRERDAILARVAQPVWVVDHRGRFRYANPAALAALGYDDLSELEGRPGHETVHYKYPDGTPFPEEECPVTFARLSGETHQEDESWLVRKDGSILRIAYSTAPFDLPEGRGSVTAFTDIEAHLEAEQAARERDIADARAAELHAARRRTIEAADAARAQLARDLHDGAQQQFVTALLNFQLAAKKAESDPAAAAKLQETALDLTQAGIAELRDLAAGLHPGTLTDHGLGPAVQALAARLPVPTSADQTIDRRLPAPVEASVYFFVSEALTNIVKHARAGRAWVRLEIEDDRLLVEIRDDGVGGATMAGGGVGLAGLADRIAALDGELTVTSPAGQGTTLRAEIPLA